MLGAVSFFFIYIEYTLLGTHTKQKQKQNNHSYLYINTHTHIELIRLGQPSDAFSTNERQASDFLPFFSTRVSQPRR